MPENEDGTLRLPERGHIEPTDWAAVVVGNIVQDRKDHLHTVLDVSPDGTKLKLRSTHPVKEVIVTRPTGPVNLYVPSEEECLLLLNESLGARYLRDFEEREHTIAARGRFRMDPIAANAQNLRDHLWMAHGIVVDDVLYRFKKAEERRKEAGERNQEDEKKEQAKKKKVSMDELREAHDECHADPHTWPMAIAHHHAKIGV